MSLMQVFPWLGTYVRQKLGGLPSECLGAVTALELFDARVRDQVTSERAVLCETPAADLTLERLHARVSQQVRCNTCTCEQ